MKHIRRPMLDRELKKGSAELMVLSLVGGRPRHGYDIAKLIEIRSQGTLKFNIASLYPLLYRLEKRGWLDAQWIERDGRRRRFYKLTREGRKMLSEQRSGWQAFVLAMNRVVGVKDA